MKVNLPLAHVRQDSSGRWREHLLEEHLWDVAQLARAFANAFDAGDWAYLAGLWHDLGKYQPAFQGRIRTETGYDPEAHLEQEQRPGKQPHAHAGALLAKQQFPSHWPILAYLIAGHHTAFGPGAD